MNLTIPARPRAGDAPALAGAVPASPLQEQVLLRERQRPDQAAANFSFALALEGPLEPAQLGRALNDVVSRHAILRTHFAECGGEWIQRVAPPSDFPLPTVDLQLLPGEAREAHSCRIARDDAARRFDPLVGPLLRAQLHILGPTRRILVVIFHRTVCDETSLPLFLRELASCYVARVGGTPVSPGSASQYAEHAALLRRNGPEQEAALAWWRARLNGAPDASLLPTDAHRPSGARASRRRVEKLELPSSLRTQLIAFAYREGVEPLVVLYAAFAVLLQRYSRRADFVLGLRGAERRHPDTVQLIGPFGRELPCRPDLAGDPSFHLLLDRLRTDLRDAISHAGGAFARPDPRRSETHPAARVRFAFQPDTFAGLDWPGLRLQALDLEADGPDEGFVLQVTEHRNGYTLRAGFDGEQHSEALVQRLLGHYGVLLQAALDRSESRIGDLPLLSGAERRRLGEWNQTAAPFPRDATLQELFAARAAASPAATAVAAGSVTLSYSGLDLRANQLARHLRAAGMRPATVVGVLLESTTDLPVCLLALLRANGTGLWLDPRRPRAELARLVAAARPGFILTNAAGRSRVPPGPEVVLLDDECEAIERADASPLALATGPDDPALLVETSGSTGAPRLVELTQRAIVSRLHALKTAPGLRPDDVVLVTGSLPGSPLITQVLLPLIVGARLVLAPPDVTEDRTRFEALLASRRITVLMATPATWQSLVSAGWTGSPGLRLVSTGAPITRALAERLRACGRECWNVYGAAETAGGCLAFPLHAKGTGPGTGIGRPLANVHAHLLDDRLQPVPVGLPGELYLGGESIGHRYLGDPSLSVERFILDPFRRVPGARLFRTGDLGRRLPQGEIELQGRSDSFPFAPPEPPTTDNVRRPVRPTSGSSFPRFPGFPGLPFGAPAT